MDIRAYLEAATVLVESIESSKKYNETLKSEIIDEKCRKRCIELNDQLIAQRKESLDYFIKKMEKIGIDCERFKGVKNDRLL